MTHDAEPDIDRFVSSIGSYSPELSDVEVFHESTKLFPCHELAVGRRIGAYLTSPRALQETASNRKIYRNAPTLTLNPPRHLTMSLGDALDRRRSERAFVHGAMSVDDLSELLSCLRVNRIATSDLAPNLKFGFRCYPSGGGLYPVETYLLLTNVAGVEPCVAHYEPHAHVLRILGPMPDKSRLSEVFMDRDRHLERVSLVAICTALFERSVVKYGARGYRFSVIEAGTVSFLLSLAATSMKLGSLHWGGYYDDQLASLLGVDGVTETVLNCLFVGAV